MTFPLKEGNYSSLLNALDDQRIVNFQLRGELLIIGESCDGYFERSLTKEQFGRFIGELQQLYNEMPDL